MLHGNPLRYHFLTLCQYLFDVCEVRVRDGGHFTLKSFITKLFSFNSNSFVGFEKLEDIVTGLPLAG
jgi:hypothetical protein